jgi:hypothetical protein
LATDTRRGGAVLEGPAERARAEAHAFRELSELLSGYERRMSGHS